MNKVEIAEYEKTIKQILTALKKYERKIFPLKQQTFTNNRQITLFYRNAETDIKDAIRHIGLAYELHKHYILKELEKQNIITSNRYEREKSK